jgi:hypothetical protein
MTDIALHEAKSDSHLASQKKKKALFLWNPKVHYHAHKSLLLVPSQMNLVQFFPAHNICHSR